jgi:hypothetical protein
MSTAQPYQQRVVVERNELDIKLTKLKAFLNKPMSYGDVPKAEIDRLILQSAYMQSYLDVLNERIAAFNKIEP